MKDFVDLDLASLADEPAASAQGAAGQDGLRRDTLVAFVGSDLKPGSETARALGPAAELIERAASVADFKGKARSALDIMVPAGLGYGRLLVVGLDSDKDVTEQDYVTLGGFVMGKLREGGRATVLFEAPKASASDAAAFALGVRLRAYRFDRYKSKKPDKEPEAPTVVTMRVADLEAVKTACAGQDAVAAGVYVARTLVNEPPNVLFPIEFARRASELAGLGVEVEVLDRAALEAVGMRALLAVGQGSRHESRVVIMRWNGGPKEQKPVAFIGKGVTFDTGGISIKPAAGMEDMKGDMAGAACVVGLMHALATRKAKCNVVAAIGLVENMPDGNAQRPGDIVTALSGTTIEIINTDAEGRLVLADLLWHIQATCQPQFMVNLATLTGAIIVALAHEHAGLFTNDDELSSKLHSAGVHTGEKVWRLPLGPAYDKLIESKFADIKNTGGRHGGSITAAQFLQRFVNDIPWAHLDIAGTGMGSPAADEIQPELGLRLGRSPARPPRGRALRGLRRAPDDDRGLVLPSRNAAAGQGAADPAPAFARSGWRVCIQATGRERIEALDTLLWTYDDASFLPHGTAQDGNAARQPVLLTDDETNPNGASVRFFIDGAAMLPALAGQSYERAVLLFNGADEDALQDARRQWTGLKSAGHPVAYWQQTEDGRWEKRA